jgi:S-formylglutathione hydrolase FrmB
MTETIHMLRASAIILALLAWIALPVAAQTGTVEEILVHGYALEGNLDGNDVERSVFVYLPPSYSASPDRHYPVAYLLHGYGLRAARWMTLFNVEGAANRAFAALDTAREMIVVSPSTYTIYDGSMYSNSVTAGNWEDFIADDLVAYIDSHYRTIVDRMSRGLAGHSMGGYGTMRIGMKRPDVFSALYPMAACCMMEWGEPSDALATAGSYKTREDVVALRYPNKGQFARAAAWSPNPSRPPFFADLPMEDGVVRPEIQAKWIANSIIPMLGQYTRNLQKYTAIQFDVGTEDNLITVNNQLDAAMTEAGIAHIYLTFPCDHNNKVSERIEQHVLPFFAEHLAFE